MTRKYPRTVLIALAVSLASCGAPASQPGVTGLQNGVSPTPEYAGCTDTWIGGSQQDAARSHGSAATLTCGADRRILVRFDLSPIPAGHTVHKAVLRLAHVGFPHKPAKGWPVSLECYRVTRQWQDTANWQKPAPTKDKEAPAGDWKSPGGDIDRETDFGRQAKGLIATDTFAGGPWGHMHELDVTGIVRRWHGGKMPNHGLAISAAAGSRGVSVAGSEWYVPAYRPMLMVAHGPKGNTAAVSAPLSAAPKDVEPDPISATPDAGKPKGDYAVVRVGQNANCALRGGSTDAYVKEAVAKYPGTWGWMNMCRVGGQAGDFSRTLLYFDLSGIPRNASIKQARLCLSLTPWTNREVRGYRYGAYLLKLPAQPGWKAAEVTSLQPMAGRRWPKGGLLAASKGKPLAVGKVVAKEVTRRGRKTKVDDTIEFDLTGAVRAWASGKVPNCGVVLDNRLEGGAYDVYSSRSFKPEKRPYLEITLSPAVRARPKPIQAAPAPPPGDYWVKPMREAHKRFKGKPGTLAQYGDSITISMAFLAFRFGKGAPPNWVPPRKELALKNTPPELKKQLEVVDKHSDRNLWFRWKGAQWGNTGMTTSPWLFNNINGWQKKMNPEASVILFGTNDLGSICPPQYTEYMAASIRRMLQDGTVPMLTTVPPASGRAEIVKDAYYPACLSIAHGFNIPVIDYYGEIMRRRPDDWDGRLAKFKDYKGFDVPTMISRDGTHPAHPKKYHFDFSEEAINNSGYILRDYLTIRKYYEVITKVFQAKP